MACKFFKDNKFLAILIFKNQTYKIIVEEYLPLV
jgi:hypothetical protein